MATVTGLTAARMLEIEAASIVSGAVNLAGRLQLQTRGGDTVDAGYVKGEQGPPGIGPTGTVVMHAAPTIPVGWLKCDGSAVRREDYPKLFEAIGTTYGSGDNLYTFNLPNLVGRVPVGLGGAYNVLGATGGSETVTLTADQMPVHTHVQDPHNHSQNAHSHTQNEHNHSQNSHDHGNAAHTHTSGAHDHSQAAHSHGADAGSLGWVTNAFGSGTKAGIYADGAARSTTSTTADNYSTAVTTNAATNDTYGATATNNAVTATNNSGTASNNSTTATNKNAGGGAAHPNMQPYQVLNYIIKT